MKTNMVMLKRLIALAAAAVFSIGFSTANATNAPEGCGDFGECKVLVEINSTDGDIGFHFLGDADDLVRLTLYDPSHRRIYSAVAYGSLRRQKMTESFVESAEPLCWEDPEAEEDWEDIVTLQQFIHRWRAGKYKFVGVQEDGTKLIGRTRLSFKLPAAPKYLQYKEEEDDEGDVEGEISWKPGDDLGNCASKSKLYSLKSQGKIPVHPKHVKVASWEVVFEPEFEDDDPNSAKNLKFVNRIGADEIEMEDGRFEVEVPDDYLETLPDDTLVKIEVGAIGFDHNATFTEIGDICVNVDEGCEED